MLNLPPMMESLLPARWQVTQFPSLILPFHLPNFSSWSLQEADPETVEPADCLLGNAPCVNACGRPGGDAKLGSGRSEAAATPGNGRGSFGAKIAGQNWPVLGQNGWMFIHSYLSVTRYGMPWEGLDVELGGSLQMG